MRKEFPFLLVLSLCFLFLAPGASTQNANGRLDFLARITPTAAHPEPVRQFTFYVLTKSYTEISKDVEEQDAPPDREKFISDLKVSPELKDWLKAHDVLDLTTPNLDRLLTPDEILHVPEFLAAYQRTTAAVSPMESPNRNLSTPTRPTIPKNIRKRMTNISRS